MKLISHVAAVVIFIGLSALAFGAEATQPAPAPSVGFDINAIVETAIRSLGPLAILGWYLYYDKSKSQPRRDRDTAAERTAAAALYEHRVDKLVEAHRHLAESFAVALKAQADAFSVSATRMADVHEKMVQNCYFRQSLTPNP